MEKNKFELSNLIKLKNWWFLNSNLWFNSNDLDDLNITNEYEYLISCDFDEEYIIMNKNLSIGYIILNDQITRHVARAKKYDKKYGEKYILENLNKILKFSKKFYNFNKNILEGFEFCFVLLPLRHSNNFNNQIFVITETWNKLENSFTNELINIYKNYLKVSYERAIKGSTNLYKFEFELINFDFINILDSKCIKYLKDDSKVDLINDKLLNICNNLKTNKNDSKKYILSISGGVDSMILANILYKLNIDFVMIHINYANRGEICEYEKKFLSYWANIYNVELYIRDIYEISRPKCMQYDLRNLYEDYTRNVRYHSYLDVIEQKRKIDINKEWYILLGHNHDDCIENILANISNKTKYENLKGMEYFTEIKFKEYSINFIRPLLTITKEEIYNYAKNMKIQYLKDSTPKWSQRGLIRDTIRPALEKWNESSIKGFEELSIVLKESIECIDLLITEWLKRIKIFDELTDKEKIKIQTENKLQVIKLDIIEIKINKIFWSRFFEKIKLKISSKSLCEFINKINLIKNKYEIIQTRQISKIQINKNNKLYWWKINSTSLILGFE